METILELEQLNIRYGGLQALKDVSFKVNAGEVVALMGPNGAGKSTVLKAIFGLAPLLSGQIIWRGHKVIPIAHEIVKKGIAFVPQGRRVFTNLTAQENLEIGGYILNDVNKIKQRIEELMQLFPVLAKKRFEKSGHLSGGQQQLLAIARGLMTNPELLLLDEPTLGLSPIIVKEIFQAIKDINQQYKTAVIVVEHNVKSVLGIVNQAYILNQGQIVAKGNPGQLLDDNILEKVFLGKLVT